VNTRAHLCRSGRDRREAICLTEGGLPDYGLIRDKSAEVIVVEGTRAPNRNWGGLIKPRRTERYSSKIRYGGSNFEFASRISKYDKGIIGVKSYYIMLVEPPYTACPELDSGRPAWFTHSEAERVRWCEKRTSSLTSGEAVYSIVCSCFYSTRDCRLNANNKLKVSPNTICINVINA